MLTDEGQVAKAALRADWFLKWGRHHLLALMRAHELQIRHNIKDPSVQHYSGVLPPDDRVEERCRQAFLSVPLPSYAVKSNVQYLAGEGCIDGTCLVEMANKEMVQVSELKAGDVTASGAKVRFILINVSMTNNYPFELVKIGNLAITPWHPIQLNQTEKWVFPNDVDDLKSEGNLYIVYNIVLDRDHFVMIDGIKVITIGHGIINDAVASHEYFGTNKIIDDIMKLNPDQFGRVVCYRTSWTRDSSNQRVNGMIF